MAVLLGKSFKVCNISLNFVTRLRSYFYNTSVFSSGSIAYDMFLLKTRRLSLAIGINY